jgi:hypothetical protein
MPPEHEAPAGAFYDHEQDEPRGRRRRAVADWGVNEDVFDRMPSRRFVRRGEEPHERARRDEDSRVAGEDSRRGDNARLADRGEDSRRGDNARLADRGVDSRRGDNARFVRGEDSRRVDRGDDVRRSGDVRRGDDSPRGRFVREDDAPRSSDRDFDATRSPVDAPGADAGPQPRRYDDWGGDALYEDQPVSRTIVIEREPELDETLDEEPPAPRAAAEGRRTVVIGGHPDRLPVPRSRPPRSAVDRIGPRPDRIVAYAVGLGFLLILIAILTSH